MKLVCSFLTILLIVSSAFATPIPQGTAQVAADWAAESTWSEITLLEINTLLGPNSENCAYAVTCGINGTIFLDESVILDGYNLRQQGLVDEGWDLARSPEDYAHVIVAVDNQYGPILEMCEGLPAHKIFREDLKDMGEDYFGQSVEIFEKYYLFPLENWYRVSDGQTSIVVNPRRMLILEPSTFITSETIYHQPGNPTAPYYWDAAHTQPVPPNDDLGYIADVPNFNQDDTDCGPHSSAQSTGYWDNHTYVSAGPWSQLIDPDFWGLRDEMRTAMGWVSGSGVTMTEICDGIESVCNDISFGNNYSFDAVLHNYPDYSTCCDAVNAGRPGVIGTINHPVYGNHAMSLVGFNDAPTQMIQVHDNWPPSNDEPYLDWGSWFDGFVDIFPGGGSTTPITLASFSGSYNSGSITMSWTTACEIDCYGYNIIRHANGSEEQVNTQIISAIGNACESTTYQLVDDKVHAGTNYTYKLETIFMDGRSEISGTTFVKTLTHSLEQNAPNPFNPITTIRYEVPVSGFITLKVYDMAGSEVASMVNEYQEANSYSAIFDGRGLASGVYFYQLQAGEFTSIRKMVLMK